MLMLLQNVSETSSFITLSLQHYILLCEAETAVHSHVSLLPKLAERHRPREKMLKR